MAKAAVELINKVAGQNPARYSGMARLTRANAMIMKHKIRLFVFGAFGTDPLGIPTAAVATAVAFALLLPMMGMFWHGFDLGLVLRPIEGRVSPGVRALVLAVRRNWAHRAVRRLACARFSWLLLFVAVAGI